MNGLQHWRDAAVPARSPRNAAVPARSPRNAAVPARSPRNATVPAQRSRGGGDDRGSITLWLLGLCVTLLFIGGLSLDLWRGFSERRALANLADAAAVAGAGGIDEAHFRATGEVRLDPPLAEQLARRHAGAQEPPPSLTGVAVAAGPDALQVTAVGEVPLTLLRVLVPADPWHIAVTVTAEPGPRP